MTEDVAMRKLNQNVPFRLRLSFEKKLKAITFDPKTTTLKKLKLFVFSKFPSISLRSDSPTALQLIAKDPITFESTVLEEDEQISRLVPDQTIQVVLIKEVQEIPPSGDAPVAHWYWKDDDNKWKSHGAESEEIEAQYKLDEKGWLEISIGGEDYQINLSQRKQEEGLFGESRDIMRATWFYRNESGSLTPYDEDSTLELCYQESFVTGSEVSALEDDGEHLIRIDALKKVYMRCDRKTRKEVGEVMRGYNGQATKIIIEKEEDELPRYVCLGDGRDHISSNSNELLCHMMSFMRVKEAARLAQTARIFSEVFNSPSTWKYYVERDLKLTQFALETNCWKDTYKAVTSLHWDPIHTKDREAITFSSWNRSFKYNGTALQPAVLSKQAFTEGIHVIAVKINRLPKVAPHSTGIGFVGGQFDYMVTSGTKYIFPPMYYSTNFTTGTAITIILNMDVKKIQFYMARKMLKQFDIDSKVLWLTCNAGATIVRWNRSIYNPMEKLTEEESESEEEMEEEEEEEEEEDDYFDLFF